MKLGIKFILTGVISYVVGAIAGSAVTAVIDEKRYNKNSKETETQPIGFVAIIHNNQDYQQIDDVAVDFFEKNLDSLFNGKEPTIKLERRHIVNSQKKQVS